MAKLSKTGPKTPTPMPAGMGHMIPTGATPVSGHQSQAPGRVSATESSDQPTA